MMWFGQHKPRRFEHLMIYADERKQPYRFDRQRRKNGLSTVMIGVALLVLLTLFLYLIS
ncbi:MAG: hypothetical protein SOZ80_08170 [Prevotella sp.]|uniref:hypothetical protein n=1 Tax=Prevotella sp. TaxID=59823 RepID=UPI002A318EAA|nr:hypothetical protein [Prevotella sp.]MDD7317816.1 hypothetical protein [Prevotellaceae bacterium]MDY4020731.1 hypothetical protein [Prevotella sp.]